MAKIAKTLKELKENLEIEDYIEETEIENYDLHILTNEINEKASYLMDKREEEYIKHSLEDIVIIVILGLFANSNTFVEIEIFAKKHYEWLRNYLELSYGLPSICTIKRVIAALNPKELEEMCNHVFLNFIKVTQKPIYVKNGLKLMDINSLDGKTANNSKRNTIEGYIKPTNAMSAYSVVNEKCLATEFISEKTNEIPTSPKLLKRLNIKDVAITFDALNTQKDTIDYIVKNEGYYVAPIKDNQSILKEDLELYFQDLYLIKVGNAKVYEEIEKSHNQAEKRTYIFTNDIDWIYQKEKWSDLKSIGVLIKEINGEEKERKYFISNIKANHIEILSKIIRNEWSIENKLHWYLDMVFLEDKNKCYIENSQKNLNIMRKFCLGILKIVKSHYNMSMNSIRFQLSIDFENEIEQLLKLL